MNNMKYVNFILSIVFIFAVSLFTVTTAQNITVKSASIYNFYFNDSRAVDKVYTDYTSSEMAELISDFMKSWRPEKFDITEDTGYDVESIFTEEESDNMMKVKKLVDTSFLVCGLSAIFMVAIYYYFLKQDKKKLLKNRYRVSMILTLVLIGVQYYFTGTEGGRSAISEKLSMISLGENSDLVTLLGTDYIAMATTFFVGISLIVFAIITYANYFLTKPQRMFFD